MIQVTPQMRILVAVDPADFRNAIDGLGRTTGRGKNDQTKRPNRSIKEVWGYPLGLDFRERLCQIE